MAKSIPFPEQDDVATSASGKPGVGPLPIKQFPGSNLSCWQLDPDEIAEIQRTGVIWVVNDSFDKLDAHPSGQRWQPTLRVTARKEDAFLGW